VLKVLTVDTSSRYPVAPVELLQLAVKLLMVTLVAALAVGVGGPDGGGGVVTVMAPELVLVPPVL
jgi:hypothetical protein